MTGATGMPVMSVPREQGGRIVEQPKWEWVDTVFGLIVGMITTVMGMLGWISPKLQKIDEQAQALRDRMAELEQSCQTRNQLSATSIVRLEAYHEANIQRLAAIEGTTQQIDEKLDRLLESRALRKGSRGDA